MAMGRPVDCEQYSEKRNRKASDRLLAMLQQQHDYSIPAPEKTEAAPQIKIMPPIPNEAFRAALELFPDNEAFRGKVETIQRAVVAAFPGITVRDLKSERRSADVVRPRQIAMYLAKTLTLRTLPDIGRRFGGRDHTTVLHAVRKIDGLVKTDPAVAARIEQIKSRRRRSDRANQILIAGARMKKPAIHEILRRIKPLAPFHRVCHLRGLIATEPRRSMRRAELEAALKDLLLKQLKRENRSTA